MRGQGEPAADFSDAHTPPWHAAPQERRPSAVNTIEVIVGHVSEVPVVRSSRRSATEIPPARHRPDLGNPRVSRSSRRRNASRGATSPTRSISEKSPTCRLSLRLNPDHSTGLALPEPRPPVASPSPHTLAFRGAGARWTHAPHRPVPVRLSFKSSVAAFQLPADP